MSKRFGLRHYAGFTVVVATAMALFVASASGTTGAAFTSINSTVDNPGGTLTLCLNGNGDNNCNQYTDKSYVWLNGGPQAASFADGTYFFAVLSPGGQPTPNDAGTVPDAGATPKNLSDNFDAYTDRTFTVSGGAMSYSGGHDKDLANNKIRLMPYSNTLNPGGVYIMAICQYDPSDPSTYPAAPSTCKYDAFKIRTGSLPPPNEVGSCFSGTKYRDDNKNGQMDDGEIGLQGWTITIDPTPGSTPGDDATTTTDRSGNWSWCEPSHATSDGSISYTISETLQNGWRQTGNTVDQTIVLGGASVVLNSTTTPPYTYTVSVPTNANASADGLNFGNIPQGTVFGAKYYDAQGGTVGVLNLAGIGPFTALDALISGWHISQAGDTSNALTTGSSGTDPNGYPDNFTETLDPGTYTFAEVQATNGWVQTGNTTKQGTTTGNAAVTLNSNKTYSVTIPNDQPSTVSGLYFGNVCLRGGGGLTLGFWSNKNGQALEIAADFTMLTVLNLRNANGSNRDFTDTLAHNKSALNTWLLSASATNMAYMLSAQLAAMELNVAHGFVSPTALIYAPGTTSADVNGFATVAGIMAEANTSLGLSGTTVAASATRSYQEALKNALDKANNNLNFVQSSVSTCPAPAFP
jgi:hypothetical protein